MANPMWVAGGKSANPSGRPKHSARSVKGMVERFIRRNMTPNKLSRIFDELSAKDQAEMLKDLLPYVIPKQATEGISQEEVDKLYDLIETALKQKDHGKAI